MKARKNKRWLILLAGLALVLLAGSTGVTISAFSNTEQSTNNTLIITSTDIVTLLDDGFEGTPWDANWDGNGTTDWSPANSKVHSGSWAAECSSGNNYLTTDNLNTSAATSITISFWFCIKDLNKGPMYVQIYDGSSYNTLYDIFTYPGAQKNTYYQYTETITDSQYFRSDFRLRFDGSGVSTDVFVDDVLITRTVW
ncbi:hypothetical protein ACFLVH_03360 [Chloroflexota bacterium]